MSDAQKQDQQARVLRTSQIIVAALLLGCVLFLVIALAVANMGAKLGPAAAEPEPPLITYVAIGYAVVSVLLLLVVPAVVVSAGRRALTQAGDPSDARRPEPSSTTEGLTRLWLTKTIITGALIEGSTFFLLVAYLVEQSSLSLVAAMVTIVVLALQVPTSSRMSGWMESQLMLVEQERQLGR
jgi:hypothetical protein